MATRTFKLGGQGEGKDLGETAQRIFGGTEIPVTVPDAGATAEETFANLLAACDGDHVNMRNIFVSQSAFLTKQKTIKETAKDLAIRVKLGNGETLTEAEQKRLDGFDADERGALSLEEARVILTDIGAGTMPKHTPRGEGESKPRGESIKKAVSAERERQVKDTQAMLAALPAEVRASAIEALRATNPDLHKALTEGESAPAAEATPETNGGKKRR